MCITCSMIKIGQFSGQSVDDPDDWLFTQIIRQAPTMRHFSEFISKGQLGQISFEGR